MEQGAGGAPPNADMPGGVAGDARLPPPRGVPVAAAPYYRYFPHPPAATHALAHAHAPAHHVPQLQYMEGQLTTQAMLVEQQRRIKHLEAELAATRNEVARLHAQARAGGAAGAGAGGAPAEEKKPSSRYWTPDEHKRFLEGLELFGPRDIKAISRHVGTRTPTQVRTHSQKYWQRVERERKKAEEQAAASGAGSAPPASNADVKHEPQSIAPAAAATSPTASAPTSSAPTSSAPIATATSTSPRRRSSRPRTRTAAAAAAAIEAEKPNGARSELDGETRKRLLRDDEADDRKERRVKPRGSEELLAIDAAPPAPQPPVPLAPVSASASTSAHVPPLAVKLEPVVGSTTATEGGADDNPATAGGLLGSALPSSELPPAPLGGEGATVGTVGAGFGAGSALPSSELPPAALGGGALPASELPQPAVLTSVPSTGTLAGLLPLGQSVSSMGLAAMGGPPLPAVSGSVLTSVPSLSALPHVPSIGALGSLPRVSSTTGLPTMGAGGLGLTLPRVASSLTAAWKGAEAALAAADRLPPRAPPPPNPLQRTESAASIGVGGGGGSAGAPTSAPGASGSAAAPPRRNLPRNNSILSLLSGLPTAALNEDLDDPAAMALHDPKWSAESS